MRIFQQLGAHMVSGKGYFSLRSCAQIFSDGVVPEPVITMRWPECTAYLSGQIPDQTVLVAANYSGLPIEANVALSIVAGPAGWLSLLIHMIGVEVYVSDSKLNIFSLFVSLSLFLPFTSSFRLSLLFWRS